MAINKKYSFKDFTGKSFLNINPDEFSNSEIKGSCFYQESPTSKIDKNPSVSIFPEGMIDVTFTRCNLDNVIIPSGNTIGEKNSHKKIRIMNDGRDWILDNDNKPVEKI